MRISNLLFLLVLILPVTGIYGQDDRVRGAVRTKSGLLIIWNEPKGNFTLELRGKEFEPVENKNVAFLVDGKFLQIVSPFRSEFLSAELKPEKLDESKILAIHRDWEADYLGNVLKEKLHVESEEIKLKNDKAALIWSFVVPKSAGGSVKKQIFLTVVKRDSLLALNGAVTPEVTEELVRRFLIETANTLRVYEKPLTQKDAIELAEKAN